MARLQRMSRRMRALIALGAAILLFSTAWGWTARDKALDALALPGLLLALFTLLQAWRLFGAYGRGEVFGPVAVRHMRALGWALIATAAWHVAGSTLRVLLLTWQNLPGHRQLTLAVSWEDYTGVLFGGLLLAMAWAMTEAGRIQQDNAGFV